MSETAPPRYRFRTLFLSDIHLGMVNCKAKMLRELLNRIDADRIYLVGDIIDGQRLRLQPLWPQTHEQVLDLLHEKAARGTEVIYLPGNHDDGLRDWIARSGPAREAAGAGHIYRGITYRQMDVHVDARGNRHLIIHGDQFDGLMQRGHSLDWLYGIGDRAYDLMAFLNRHINQIGEKLGFPYWSLAGFLKGVTKMVVGICSRLDDKLVQMALRHEVTGVFFGHTHLPLDKVVEGITIRNDGDMVDSITCFVEDQSGAMHLLRWAPLYNRYKKALRSGATMPHKAFAPLVTAYGAIEVTGDGIIDFRAVPVQAGDVDSAYAEVIGLAREGLEYLRLNTLKEEVKPV